MNYSSLTPKMFELNISYLLRTSYRFSNKENPILMRLKYRGARKDLTVGLSVRSEDWLSGGVAQKAKKAQAINQQLQDIAFKVKTTFEKMKSTLGDFSLEELVDRIKGTDSR